MTTTRTARTSDRSTLKVEMHIIRSKTDWRIQMLGQRTFRVGTGKYTKTFPVNVSKVVAAIRKIPSQPRWDPDDKAWVFPVVHPAYPSERPSEWYVRALADWAVQKHWDENTRTYVTYADKVKWREADMEEFADDVDKMLPFEGEHYMLLNPYPYQLLGVRYALDHKRCIFGDQQGLGKLQPYSEPVSTPSGFRKMGDLKVGDALFGRDGNVYHVQEIFEHGVKDVYKVYFNDGTWTRAGGEHLWSVRDVNMRRRGQGWKTMTTDEILSKGLTWNMSPSRTASGRKPTLRWEIPMCEPVKYQEKIFLIHPYILGVLIGDGCLSTGVSEFACPDEKSDIAERVRGLIPDGYTLVRRERECPHYAIRKPDGVRFNYVSQEIARIGLNVTSLHKHIPHEYLYSSVEQRKELLCGLMDTDGSCPKGKTALSFCTISPQLSKDVRELVLSLGGQATIHEYDRADEGKPVEYRVAIRLPFNPFHTKKKAERYDVKRGNYNSRYIERIEPDGSEQSRCILVDAPDHLYLTRDYIVTHNTLQAICTVVKAHNEAQRYGETFPVLVICPVALKINWQREFKKFAGIDSIILDDKNKGTWHLFYEQGMCNVFITNYESLRKFFVVRVNASGRMTQKSIEYDRRKDIFRCVIIDESHKCKTSSTQQSKFVEGICAGKRWVFELTGTPVVNNNTDLIQQLKIMGRLNEFGGLQGFMGRYCEGVDQSSNVKELNHRLWMSCFFRREKMKVLTQLPEKSRQYLMVDISTTKEYSAAEEDMVQYLRTFKQTSEDDIRRKMKASIMVKMGLLKQISARGKIKPVADFIHDIIDGGEKLIVFAYLKEVVEELKKHFPKAVTVTGSDSVEQKQKAVDDFQTKPSCKLIILNYKSGGTGLTLTAASRVAFIEFPWTYSDCEQAEDRAHRNGQKNNVNCYYFLGNGTIDEYMYKIIQTKKNIADGVTGTTTNIQEMVTDMALEAFGNKL